MRLYSSTPQIFCVYLRQPERATLGEFLGAQRAACRESSEGRKEKIKVVANKGRHTSSHESV